MNYIIFPTQIYYNNELIKKIKSKYTNVYLIEEPTYFIKFKYHKLKLAYHRASMKKYYDYLKSLNLQVFYIEYKDVTELFYKKLKNVTFIDPVDNKLLKKIKTLIQTNILDWIQFLISREEIPNILSLCKTKTGYRNDLFYKYMRIKLKILVDSDNKPIGDQWSFDKDNRQSFPKNMKIPELITIKKDKYIIEAIEYVNNNFPNNYGSLDNFIYPIDYDSTIKWLNNFLELKFNNFGPYEDAVLKSEPDAVLKSDPDAVNKQDLSLFHSVLTPMLNIGLITDKELLEHAEKYYEKNMKTIKLQSYEGFIRQIIGWRTYVLSMYIEHGEKIRKSNILKHKNKLNEKWWYSIGLEPVDSLINKIVKYSYAHHIERLMYLGSIMLLLQIDPKEVYRIFMEWTIDAYDWVMVPNIFCMSQYASDIMMTRPYINSSNYILKMSNFKRGEWCKIWDAIYYSFINKHKKLLSKNYATAMQVKHWDNKSEKDQKELLEIAQKFKNSINKN